MRSGFALVKLGVSSEFRSHNRADESGRSGIRVCSAIHTHERACELEAQVAHKFTGKWTGLHAVDEDTLPLRAPHEFNQQASSVGFVLRDPRTKMIGSRAVPAE